MDTNVKVDKIVEFEFANTPYKTQIKVPFEELIRPLFPENVLNDDVKPRIAELYGDAFTQFVLGRQWYPPEIRIWATIEGGTVKYTSRDIFDALRSECAHLAKRDDNYELIVDVDALERAYSYV